MRLWASGSRDRLPDGVHAAGHVLGLSDDAAVAASGVRAGRAAAGLRSNPASRRSPRRSTGRRCGAPASAIGGGRKQFVCLCEDVTVKELRQGVRGRLRQPRDPEALQHGHDGPVPGQDVPRPRGTGPRAVRRRDARRTTGLTTARPPFQPVPLAALAGPHLAPVRRTAMHERHEALGATLDRHGRLEAPARTTATSRRVPRGARGGRAHRRHDPRQARRPGRRRRRVPRLAAPEPVQRPQGGARALPRDARRRRDHPRRRHGRPARARSASSSRPRPATSTPSSSGSAGGSPADQRRRRRHRRHRPATPR